MITINGNQYRNLPEQVEKNKQDIENITKDKTVKIYFFNGCNDVDPNVPVNFTGTITILGGVVISVVGIINVQNITKTSVVCFSDVNPNDDTVLIDGYENNRVRIDLKDFDDMREYVLY